MSALRYDPRWRRERYRRQKQRQYDRDRASIIAVGFIGLLFMLAVEVWAFIWRWFA